MTEGNTTITLHNESLDHIVGVLKAEEPLDVSGRSEAIAETIESQR